MADWNERLLQSVMDGKVDDLSICIENGANIDHTRNEATALILASMYGQLEVCRRLVDLGCNIHITVQNGCTALHLAAARGDLEITRYLVEQAGISPLLRTLDGKTPYDLAAGQKERQYKEVMEYLQHVQNPNQGN